MDDLLRLAHSYQVRLSDPAFEAQCTEFVKILQSIEADFNLLHELQCSFSDFRKAASHVQTLCSKINKRWPVATAQLLVADASEMGSEPHPSDISMICESYTLPGGFEHKCEHDRVLQTLLLFRVAAQNLNHEWQETERTHPINTTGVYPFTEDFEDVLSKIITWTETAFRRVDGYCISCCDPDHTQCSLTVGCPCCDRRNSQRITQTDTPSIRSNLVTKKNSRGTQRRKKVDS